MKNMKNLVLCAALTPSLAGAGEIQVNGTIASGSCEPGASTLLQDIRVIPRDETSVTGLPVRRPAVRVKCPAATRYALRLIDARADSVAQSVENHAPERGRLFGLGTHNGRNIGAYWLTIRNNMADGDYYTPLSMGSSESGAPGSFRFDRRVWNLEPDVFYATSYDEGATSPSALTMSMIDLEFRGVVAPMAELGSGEEVKLDGMAIVELIIL